MKEYCISGVDGLPAVALKIITDFQGNSVFAFYGDMGAGKTTLIKNICKVLGVTDNTASPTYSIVNEYNSIDEKKIYHFDFYRLKNLREALDIGCEEYFFSGHYCFIEWPQVVESILPDNTVKLLLERNAGEVMISVIG